MGHVLYGLALSLAFYPGIEGSATSPRWAVAVVSLYFVRWWCLPFIVFALWRLGIDQGTHWAVICGALCWGFKSTEADLLGVLRGLAIGIGLNSALAVSQYFGFNLVPQAIAPAGLFVNRDILSESAALVFVLAFYYCEWGFCLISLPALILGASRASWLAVFLSVLPYLTRRQAIIWGGIVALFAIAILLAAKGNYASLDQRLMLWGYALSDLRFLGNGPFDFATMTVREPRVHNDYLQLVYSLGIIGLMPILISAWCLIENTESRPFIIAFGVIAVFGFPLEMPLTAWLGAFVLGHHLGIAADERRVFLRSRLANA